MAALDENMLACTYATLILHDDGLPITADNVAKLTEEAGLEVPGFWPKLFVSAIADSNINELMMNVVATSPGGGAAAGGAAPAAAAAAPAAGGKPAADAKKKAPEPEEEEDMGFSLFD
ncbi:hypothetical protein GUITHDRAFT_196205 [Guillardia theta CCMP2712]|nr:hypothetical protein GUITHDRAFT_196205 [Guillardia theta CCMP2712]EKX47943.1 hypothetical protein GUITHDRAFT_196205 [Guillardia theta CCMP2712]|eukprot:XP_005834923.1 hypothetical protein GUITHDRAFT_196205 [Guillardia theta CCMP2712]